MILVTRLNGTEYLLNQNLIETIEETPDTVIKLTNDKKLIVKEKSTEIMKRIIDFNRKVFIEKIRVE